MAYTDAIEYLKEHDIKKEDGSYYEFGDVSIQPFNCHSCISRAQYSCLFSVCPSDSFNPSISPSIWV